MLKGDLAVLAGKGEIHFRGKPDRAGRALHISNPVRDSPPHRRLKAQGFFDLNAVALIPRPDGTHASHADFRSLVTDDLDLIAGFHKIALLAVMTPIELIHPRVRMHEMVQQAGAPVP